MIRLLFLFFANYVCFYASAQIQKEWSIIHQPFNSLQNSCYLQTNQLILTSQEDIICGWLYNVLDSGYFALGITSHSTYGTLNWENQYHGVFGTNNELYNVLTDSLDNVYAMGEVNINNIGQDNVILKYDQSGNLMWKSEEDSIRTYGVQAVITGNKINMLRLLHPSLLQYDLNGNLTDSVYNDSIPGTSFSYWGSLFTINNSLYYGSDFGTIGSSNKQLFASKVINGDSVVWKKWVDASPFDDGYTDITADIFGNAYILANADRLSNNSYIFSCAFDSNGDTLWTNSFGGDPGQPSYPTDIAVDDAGHVYVVANIYNNTQAAYITRIVQYNALTGVENWSHDFDSTYAYWINFSKVSIDSSTKDVYLAYNLIPENFSARTCIVKFSPAGNIVWRVWFDSLGVIEAFVFDQLSSFYIGGTFLTKFSLSTDIEDHNNIAGGEINLNFSPISNVITISAGSLRGQQYTLSIYDASGRIVYNEQGKTMASFEKSIPYLRRKDGLYLVILRTDKEILTGKVLVY